MAVNLVTTSKKLMQALNAHDYKLTFSTKQFLGVEGEIHTMYILSNAVWDSDKHKYYNKELYSSTSLVRIVLYLRDMWFQENGWELPTDQPLWNQIREELKEANNGQYRA